jgi:excisionase family DNA binding protein
VGEERTGRDLDRLTVAEAASVLGISQDAVRKRIARGTISHDRDESGRVFVYLSPSETVHKTDQDTAKDAASKTVQVAYIRSLEDQIDFLRRELERKDGILLNLTERIPQLEVPSEPAEAAETAEDQQGRGRPHSDRVVESQEGVRRPWWRKLIGRGR